MRILHLRDLKQKSSFEIEMKENQLRGQWVCFIGLVFSVHALFTYSLNTYI